MDVEERKRDDLLKIECIIAALEESRSTAELRNDLHFVTGNGIKRGEEEREKFFSYGDELKSS